jgi:hypothetical protein
MKGQYIIIDIRTMEYMKNQDNQIKYYDTLDDALLECGMYEFENAWVVQLVYNHIEEEDRNRTTSRK